MKTIHMPLVGIPSIIIDVPAPVEPAEPVEPVVRYTLTVSSANASMGTVSGGGTYVAGTTVTIVATPNSGYRFVRWSDNDTNATRSVTVSANASYTATFEAVTPDPGTPDDPEPGDTLPSGVYYGEMPASITGFSTKAESLISAITAAHVKAAVAAGSMVKATNLPITSSNPAVVTTSDKKSYILALVPNGTNRVVKQYDGLSEFIPFGADEGQYANGDVTLVVDGTTYKLYGQYSALADSIGVPITIE